MQAGAGFRRILRRYLRRALASGFLSVVVLASTIALATGGAAMLSGHGDQDGRHASACSLTLQAFVTGYIATGDRTATGTWPAVGRTVAVDPRVIPLGSTVSIQDLGTFTAEDTGAAIVGPRVDVYVATAADAAAITGNHQISVVLPSAVCPG
jgi:3D (Asp-Asp-Asp) domain-containing protein